MALRRRSGLEVSFRRVFDHRLLQLRFCQKLYKPRVLLFQLSQPSGLLGLHAAVLLSPEEIRGLCHLDNTADLDDGLALGDQLLRGFQLADDLLGRVPGALHGYVSGPVWPDEYTHLPWTDFRGPRHCCGAQCDSFGLNQPGSTKRWPSARFRLIRRAARREKSLTVGLGCIGSK